MTRNEATAQLADDLIGAAQELEKAAKALRADAKAIRQHGLPRLAEDADEHLRSLTRSIARQQPQR